MITRRRAFISRQQRIQISDEQQEKSDSADTAPPVAPLFSARVRIPDRMTANFSPDKIARPRPSIRREPSRLPVADAQLFIAGREGP